MRARFLLFCVAAFLCAPPARPQEHGSRTLGAVAMAASLPNGIHVETSNGGTVQIVALRDDIVRVRISITARLPEDASWAVAGETRGSAVTVEREDTADTIGVRTPALHVGIARSDLRLNVRDNDG